LGERDMDVLRKCIGGEGWGRRNGKLVELGSAGVIYGLRGMDCPWVS
jgi:hypothetical protein